MGVVPILTPEADVLTKYFYFFQLPGEDAGIEP
jgi:hypothetical protein